MLISKLPLKLAIGYTLPNNVLPRELRNMGVEVCPLVLSTHNRETTPDRLLPLELIYTTFGKPNRADLS